MSADEFLDTNIFVYLFDEDAPRKRRIAQRLVRRSVANGSGCISHQVIQETMNVVIGKLGSTPERMRELMDDVLFPLWRVKPTRALYRRSLDVRARYGFAVYDSLIVAAVLDAGCRTLYSEDLQHGQRLEGQTIVDPFRRRSEA